MHGTESRGRLEVAKDKFQIDATDVTMDRIGKVRLLPKRVFPDNTEAEEVPPPRALGKLVTRKHKGQGCKVLEAGRLSGPDFLRWPRA